MWTRWPLQSCCSMRLRFLVERAALGAALMLAPACGARTSDGGPVRVTIPQGASFAAAADSLRSAGVIRSSRLFRAYAKVTRRDRELRPGTYELPRNSGWAGLIEALTTGAGLQRTVTVPEGLSLAAIITLLSTSLEIPADSLRAAAADTAHLRELDIPTSTLEGYLFPETYQFPEEVGARDVVDAMVRQFQRAWRSEWNDRLEEIRMTRHQIVTLASIVEKEVRIGEERPIISAVYHNRLRIGMALQADPTVQYARGQHTSRVLHRDLDIESPYNTYRNPGLPPGPIASPGAASLEAALYPADVPYRFMVAHPDGHHIFNVSFADHTRTIGELRRLGGSRSAEGQRAPNR